jgi:hypothetical protein
MAVTGGHSRASSGLITQAATETSTIKPDSESDLGLRLSLSLT